MGNLSPVKKAVIKEIDYDFPEDGVPTIRLKTYDKGFKLSGKENQKVWQAPAPGILYSEIAEQIAQANGLIPVVAPTVGYRLRVVQSNVSDAQFLKELAATNVQYGIWGTLPYFAVFLGWPGFFGRTVRSRIGSSM